MEYEAVIEGLLFVVGDDGLSFDQLVSILEIGEEEVKEATKKLQEEYLSNKRGIRIDFLGNKLK